MPMTGSGGVAPVDYDGDKSESDDNGHGRAGRSRGTKVLIRRSERSKKVAAVRPVRRVLSDKLKSARWTKAKAAKVAEENPNAARTPPLGQRNPHEDLCSTERQALSQVLSSKASPIENVKVLGQFNSPPPLSAGNIGRLSSRMC